MIKRSLLFIFLAFATIGYGQDQVSSPYSYFGIGLPTSKGSAESRAMGGLAVASDSIHYSFQNPAGLGDLQLTTYTMGITQKFTNPQDAEGNKDNVRNTSFDYIAIGIPTGRLNFGFGIKPHSSVGYKIEDRKTETLSRYEGSGGLTNVFLTIGYKITKGLNVGVEGNYNFGHIKNENALFQNNIQYSSREKNRSDLSGFKFDIGAQYEAKINKKLHFKTSASYSPSAELTSHNQRQLATISQESSNQGAVVNEREIDIKDTYFDLPSTYQLGVGIGQRNKWFVGAEYEDIGKTEYRNTSFSVNDVTFTSGKVYKLGGFFIPNYFDITNIFNRTVFRAGLRYQEHGLSIKNEDIDEFGISFGLGIPAGPNLSNLNLGVELGQRGTTNSGLVKENFVNLSLGISFNDRWFRKRRFN